MVPAILGGVHPPSGLLWYRHCRVLKVAFNQRPSKSCYEFTRGVSEVLNYIDSLGESDASHTPPKPFLKTGHDPDYQALLI